LPTSSGTSMTRAVGPILKTILFTILVPGSVLVLIPQRLLGGLPRPAAGPLTWLGGLIILLGASIYFRCAWEFAVRGLGTPAPIAPTKFLVTTALHRYVRNPMYIGVFLVLLGEAGLFRAPLLLCLCSLFLCARGVVRRLLRRAHAPPPVRRIVRAISQLGATLDSQILFSTQRPVTSFAVFH